MIPFLESIELRGGGVPFVLRSAREAPHAPWWETGPGPVRPALNPTAGIAAVLHKHALMSPWLDRATGWCWERIERLRTANPYELRVVLSFLDFVPDRERARRALERLRPKLLRRGIVETDPRVRGDVFGPLDVAPEPDRLSRTLFSDEMIGAHLDALERRQLKDGGWDVHFPIWTPITRFDWRGIQTVESLKILRQNGRMGSPPP